MKEKEAGEYLQALRPRLVDPRWSLPRFGHVLDQKTGKAIKFDPYRITKTTQATILSYYGDTPLIDFGDGHFQTRWLVELGSRQLGKSLVPELAALPITALSPGYDHLCIADTKERADYLHERVHFAYDRWDERLLPRQVTRTQRRGLNFPTTIGGKMRVLSAETQNVGIGQSPDSFHGSEIPFWNDWATRWNLIYPSMINRDHALMCLEATPAPAGSGSVEDWKDLCFDAKLGKGRWIYKFSPFWDGLLNRRPWTYGDLDSEEEKYLQRYGHLGLELENLAFRRFTLENVAEIRRNPELFDVFYPSDDVTCWMSAGSGVIPRIHLERHSDTVRPWPQGVEYHEFEQPNPGSQYVIGVDPAGYGARDHASFQVLEVWADEWRQVASFSAVIEPDAFAKKLVEAGIRYNKAMIVVERNGVGVATTELLKAHGYPKIYHDSPGKPGIHVGGTSWDKYLSMLIDALMDELVLLDNQTLDQMISYRNDKRVERSPTTEILTGQIGKNRRERHHWDKVSAMIMAVVGARKMPRRYRKTEEPDNVVPFSDLTYDDIQRYYEMQNNSGRERGKKRSFYRSVRRKR